MKQYEYKVNIKYGTKKEGGIINFKFLKDKLIMELKSERLDKTWNADKSPKNVFINLWDGKRRITINKYYQITMGTEKDYMKISGELLRGGYVTGLRK